MRKFMAAVAVVALLAPTAALPQAKSGNNGVYEQLNLFGEAFERIRHDAVEPVADNKLIDTAIAGMLSGLDSHSAYISETDYKAMQSRKPEEGASPGLVVTLDNSQLKVVSPRATARSAAAADIKPGDLIFAIDKEPTYRHEPVGYRAEVARNRRQRGHVDAAPRQCRADRRQDQARRRSIPDGYESRLEGGDIGYIRVAAFDDATAANLGNAVKDLRQQAGNKLMGFIVDLRNNPGGNLTRPSAAADAFIDKGDIAVVKSRKAADATKRIAATPGDVANGQPIVALVNGGTAREAELVAGALQDSHRAVLLGTKTFGESAIETIIPLNGNGAIRLTTGRYQTPSGRAIQGKGLDPDLVVSPLKLEKGRADRPPPRSR